MSTLTLSSMLGDPPLSRTFLPPTVTPTTDGSAELACVFEPSSVHGSPPDEWSCLCTMEDITLEDGNYVEYQCYPSMIWRPARYEQSIIQTLLSEQFHQFVQRVKTTDCQAELRRLLAAGPPVYLHDEYALPLEDQNDNKSDNTDAVIDTHVVKLWFASDNKERLAKLDGAVEGVEREILWNELKQFIIVEGKEAGDDDDITAEVTEDSKIDTTNVPL